MPEIPDVSAIAQQVKARIKHIEDQLKQYHVLTDELERLRAALVRLEGQARWRVSTGRRNRKPPARLPRSFQTGSVTGLGRAVSDACSPPKAEVGRSSAVTLAGSRNWIRHSPCGALSRVLLGSASRPRMRCSRMSRG